MTGFGFELRRRRLAAEVTLTGLAERLGYSKAHLSKVERGLARPKMDLARACDAALNAQGELASMVGGQAGNGHQSNDVAAPRSPLDLAPLDELPPVPSSAADLEATPLALRVIFNECRALGDQISSKVVLEVMVPHAQTLVALARASSVPERARVLWMLAANFLEYTGYMAQESGDFQAAMYWTDEAFGCGELATNAATAASALVRQAEIAVHLERAECAVEVARRVQNDSRSPASIRCLAAQREAQGHGIAGAYREYKDALTRAAQYAQEKDGAYNSFAWETNGVRNPVAVTAAWALHDLGRSAASARILDWEVPCIHSESVRTKARFSARRALAHASTGNVERSCELAKELLPVVEQLDSDTIRSDIQRLANCLKRWNTRSAVRDLQPDLMRALATSEIQA